MLCELVRDDQLELTAETQDEVLFLRAITLAIRDGGTVEVRDQFALEFDGDRRVHRADSAKRRLLKSSQPKAQK